MPSLADLIHSEISRSGPMPFRRFMELALYDPSGGYYASGRAAIGKHGDYVTSVSVSSLFGRLLAGQFEEMWEAMGRPAEFTIVEQGANTGDFAHDVLTAAKRSPAFTAALRYRIVEPFPINAERQQTALLEFGAKVEWHPSVDTLPRFTGVHFSNELLDAMPVHWVVFRGGAWRGRYVQSDATGGGFHLEDGPLSTSALEPYLTHLPPVEDYETEINLDAPAWVSAVAERLERGYVLVVDYGFSRADYYLPERIKGTLSCYRQQQRSDNPLAHLGDQDITAHVEFTSLVEHALEAGMELIGFTDQHHFMAGLAKQAFPDAVAPLTPVQQKELRTLATLMHPSLMGRAFQFLGLAKGAPAQWQGFQFGSDPSRVLGLANTTRNP